MLDLEFQKRYDVNTSQEVDPRQISFDFGNELPAQESNRIRCMNCPKFKAEEAKCLARNNSAFDAAFDMQVWQEYCENMHMKPDAEADPVCILINK